MDLIDKQIPTIRETSVKVLLINLFPFNFDKWAPKNPPIKEPDINNNIILNDNGPILLKKIAPVKFQKIPTVKNVKLTARTKSILKVLIKSIVTSNPVPEEIDPLIIPIKKIKIKNLILSINLSLIFSDDKPKSDLKNE